MRLVLRRNLRENIPPEGVSGYWVAYESLTTGLLFYYGGHWYRHCDVAMNLLLDDYGNVQKSVTLNWHPRTPIFVIDLSYLARAKETPQT